MNNSANSLIEGLERLGLIASRIRKNEGKVPQIEIDIILEELRNLYMVALQIEAEGGSPATLQAEADVLEMNLEAAAAKAAEEQRQAEEKRLAEEKRQAEEKRLAEEKRQAEERRVAEEKRIAQERMLAQEKRIAEEKRRVEEAQKKAAEEKRIAEEKRLAEEQRLAEEKRIAEEKRLAEEQRLAEEKRIAEEKRMAEEQRLAEEQRQAEERRLAEAAALRKAAEEGAKPIYAPETNTKSEPVVGTPILENLEGHRNDELFVDEPQAPAPKPQKEASLFDYLNHAEKPQEQPAVRTIADKLNQHGMSVEQQLESRVNAKKVDDLRTIININDKFVFMSDLFHNNMKAYNDFILTLNAYSNREEALAYVNEVAAQNHWKEGSTAVLDFYKVFDRKF